MKPKTVLVLGDVHFPWPNKAALKQLTVLLATLKPHTILQVGDLLDLYGLSRFGKDPGRGLPLKEEAALGRDFICLMQDSCKEYFQLEGNHEWRLHKRLQDEPDLSSTHPTMRELLGVSEKRWTPYHQHLILGKVAYMHDLGYSGVTAPKQTLDAMQTNVVFGHTHAASILYGGDVQGSRHVCMNVGWLGAPESCDYLPEGRKKNWQTAVGLVDYSHGGNAHMQLLPFVEGKFLGV